MGLFRSSRPTTLSGFNAVAATPQARQEAADSALTELRALSAGLTSQVLALLPIQAALAAGFAVSLRKGDPGTLLQNLTFATLGTSVVFSVYTLIRVHDRTRWEKAPADLYDFVLKEAQRVVAKGFWTRVGVAVTLAAALSVVLCNIVVFRFGK